MVDEVKALFGMGVRNSGTCFGGRSYGVCPAADARRVGRRAVNCVEVGGRYPATLLSRLDVANVAGVNCRVLPETCFGG